MSTFKQKIEEHFDAKAIIGFGNYTLDTYEEISTADGYEVFVHMPGGSWRNVFPESDLYYYIDDLFEVIKDHIIDSGHFYISETIAEELSMEDPNGEFWEDMCIDNNLIDYEDEN